MIGIEAAEAKKLSSDSLAFLDRDPDKKSLLLRHLNHIQSQLSIPMIADIDSGRSRTDFGAKRRKQLLFLRLSGISQAGHLLSQRIDRFDLKPMSIMEPAIEKCIGDPATT